jgi:hypothetical protein
VLADGALCTRERVPADEHSTLGTSSAWEVDAQFREKKQCKEKRERRDEENESERKEEMDNA